MDRQIALQQVSFFNDFNSSFIQLFLESLSFFLKVALLFPKGIFYTFENIYQ